MAAKETNKLLHVLVVVGAGLTGGLASEACSSGVSSKESANAADAAADGAHYDNIQPCNDSSCYPMIMPVSRPDAGGGTDASHDAADSG